MGVEVVRAEDKHFDAVRKIFYDECTTLGLPNLGALRESIRRGELLVAESSEGEVVGFVEFHVRKDKRATLYHIGVRKDWRRKGVGKKLVERLVQVCREKGCREIRLLCPKWSEAGEFYRRVGFEYVGEESKVNKKGVLREFTVWRYKLSSGKLHSLF